MTSEASDFARADNRATIQAEDILLSLSCLGFADYVEPLRLYMQRLPHDLFSDSRTKKKGKGSKRKASVATAAAAAMSEDEEESEDGEGEESDGDGYMEGHEGHEADSEPPPLVAPKKQKRSRGRR